MANLISVAARLKGGALAVIQVPREKGCSCAIVSAEASDLANRTHIAFLDWFNNPVRKRHL